MGICSQPDKPKSDPVPSFIDISAGDASFVSAKSWLPAASLQAEVNILGKLSHPNLVKLLGYCHEKERIHNTDVTSMFWFYSSSIMQRYQILAWHQFFHLMIPVSKLVTSTYGYAAPEILRAGCLSPTISAVRLSKDNSDARELVSIGALIV
ncbi:hypothetical protein POTOM_057678 [Populus tomentosa]|uniref:Protein kinase domain-containing protein n=1 Tax=Populus tomentosa TaxID=118781 RepID=A0A8X8C1Z8_POPTO|nr:hypothetical protein POTOM_057678 [Populus tomentosa]